MRKGQRGLAFFPFWKLQIGGRRRNRPLHPSEEEGEGGGGFLFSFRALGGRTKDLSKRRPLFIRQVTDEQRPWRGWEEDRGRKRKKKENRNFPQKKVGISSERIELISFCSPRDMEKSHHFFLAIRQVERKIYFFPSGAVVQSHVYLHFFPLSLSVKL